MIYTQDQYNECGHEANAAAIIRKVTSIDIAIDVPSTVERDFSLDAPTCANISFISPSLSRISQYFYREDVMKNSYRARMI